MNDIIRALAANPVADLPPPVERIRLRNKFGISQQKLATALGVTRRTIGTWEAGNGEPTGGNRDNYAAVLAAWAETEKNRSE